ncbi:hypothetical protein [Prosthecobacter fluviatilis]|uniref:Uncharacterized protein n=1 Tax=Prosthecobacter fluviatilis TaxID=445931 RepID=A0ABW0KUM2_9BACT
MPDTPRQPPEYRPPKGGVPLEDIVATVIQILVISVLTALVLHRLK